MLSNDLLREDGGYLLREDGTHFEREVAVPTGELVAVESADIFAAAGNLANTGSLLVTDLSDVTSFTGTVTYDAVVNVLAVTEQADRLWSPLFVPVVSDSIPMPCTVHAVDITGVSIVTTIIASPTTVEITYDA